ncbi:hypothetical protein Pst134EA_003287 [Puccinia striiformis f. sp. tritici]|uniref:hypothetical protein n=1 Tax=Puccinia striiformis f. sp. tritici TaxID=168172 RepID=UPI0020076A00|nr:hypothetical protein Pst134EA_003287 [Puccinia striiformis f. sp. tritici]KAH9472683.1 hypothetical protein Pst134EA_003287 [Puccinia striiformis f. sp. tritici]
MIAPEYKLIPDPLHSRSSKKTILNYLPPMMNILTATLLTLATACPLATAFNCGSTNPQNVCRVYYQLGGPVWYVRADDIKPWGAGKDCKKTTLPDKRGCCPMNTVQKGSYIYWWDYKRIGCTPPIPDPPHA